MNPSTHLARDLLDELVHQGVREVVLSPGSRSAPLAFAAARLARAGRVRLHVRLDERCAGFLAVGLARTSGEPVAVVCTSGTAVANLAPAVVEASYSALPLVVITADRPPEARGVASPQTIDQVGFFGQMVRHAADLDAARHPGPDDPAAAARTVRAAVGTALAAAMAGTPGTPGTAGSAHCGPVHLNVALRLPLVPEDGNDPQPGPVPARSGPPRARRTPLAGCDSRELDALIDVPAHGVLLVGDLPATALAGHQQWLAELAEACGWPVVAEPTANMHAASRFLPHAPLVLGTPGFLAEHPPELVVSVGLFGLSRPTLELVRAAGSHVAIELSDVGREVCDPARTARRVLGSIPLPPAAAQPDLRWWRQWQSAGAGAGRAVVAALESSGMSGPAVARRVWTAAPDDGLLLVAASWPVRHLEAVADPRRGLRVVGNRGANGIDGLVSTAWGAALAHQHAGGGPATALVGDLAFLHDHNGLLGGAGEPRPDLVIVVVDNDGGGIFHQLEQGRPEHLPWFEQLFGTPQGRDLVAVARAAGVPAIGVADLSGLDAAIERARAAGGVHVVVAKVGPRPREAALLDRVREAAAAAVTGAPGAGLPGA